LTIVATKVAVFSIRKTRSICTVKTISLSLVTMGWTIGQSLKARPGREMVPDGLSAQTGFNSSTRVTSSSSTHTGSGVIGCHLSNKSVCQITALLALSPIKSTVVVKWKCLGAITAQPRSVRPHKLTEQERRVLKRIAGQNSLSLVATLTTEVKLPLKATSAQ
jgi:hypothetical protein